MKPYAFFFLYLLFVPSGLAMYNKTLYSGWVMSDTDFMLEDRLYKVNYIKVANVTMLYFPGVSFQIEGNSCNQKGIYSACVTKQKFERHGAVTLPDARAISNVSVYIYINRTEIDVRPRLTIGNLTEGIPAQIEVRVDTIGKATEILYSVTFPDNFSVKKSEGCSIEGTTILLQGNTCTAIFIPVGGEHRLTTILQYTAADLLHATREEYIINVTYPHKSALPETKVVPVLPGVSENKTLEPIKPEQGGSGQKTESGNGLDSKLGISPLYIIYGVTMFAALGLIIFVVFSLKSKFGKSSLDKEIEMLKKQEEQKPR
ncbi:MAG: hypothetical protein HGA85_00710 [Nanoarchaeota archaeon]|nr:hypothetical protein [Nanoarchaeota archaeon]